ncbi:DNA alkylation repair protein [Paraglaciecola aquimarina]|uniref:DNA alkylation repair protein n=1 Tax=Paraglaciecola algarum TaxID=3050085 RepID=A0ABS9D125_9ALTE|nr:DNA alkylation repair protein [Paraglaciecola sp. G1-23]MCF2946633.1 DNA alkylation repair protein [Paraglaciecola sp. G1-23]
MAEPLKNHYGIEIAEKISAMTLKVYPSFDAAGFIDVIKTDYESLELMERGRKISAALKQFLPNDYLQALKILLASAKQPTQVDEDNSIASFIFMPHVNFVAENGLDNFEASMHAHYVLTQKFTSEFGIRPFIQKYPEQTMALLSNWATDDNYHVRRLVSEGTRPRLPWASRLPEFIADPQPVIKLLELLKDDPELYVRRSVANNLNDIGKDHPDLLADIAKRWLKGASEERKWLVKHALRSAIKRGEKGALEALGYGKPANVVIQNISVSPAITQIGGSITVGFDLQNLANTKTNMMVDCVIHFIKANGASSAKVFKLKACELKPQGVRSFSKKVSLKPMTTRTLYAGMHKVDVMINGQTRPLGEFELRQS